MTPLTYCSSPSAVRSVSRYARRFSSVHGTPTASNLFWHVPELSSAAIIPLPTATICFAVFFKSSISISKLLQMFCFNKSHYPRMRGHHDRVRHDIVRREKHAVGERPRNYTRRGEADGIAFGKVARSENRREVRDACVIQTLDVALVFGFPTAQEFAAEASHRSRCQDRFRAPPDTHENIDARARKTRAQRHSDVTIGEEAHTRAYGARFGNQRLVPRTVKRRDNNFGDFFAQGFCYVFDVVGDGRIEVNHIHRLGSDRDFLHV